MKKRLPDYHARDTQHVKYNVVTRVSEEWRRFGETRRKELVEHDELEGGTSFRINKRVRIHRYFRLAERVRGKHGRNVTDRIQ